MEKLTTNKDNSVEVYLNVMETLVDEEIAKQIKSYPKTLVEYLKKVEVATYALNRLPPLYASSHEGIERQKQRATEKFSEQISNAVRQGFAAVYRDPLRQSTPLVKDSQDKSNQIEMLEIADNLSLQNFTWSERIKLLTKILDKIAARKLARDEVEKILHQLDGSWADSRYRR